MARLVGRCGWVAGCARNVFGFLLKDELQTLQKAWLSSCCHLKPFKKWARVWRQTCRPAALRKVPMSMILYVSLLLAPLIKRPVQLSSTILEERQSLRQRRKMFRVSSEASTARLLTSSYYPAISLVAPPQTNGIFPGTSFHWGCRLQQ